MRIIAGIVVASIVAFPRAATRAAPTDPRAATKAAPATTDLIRRAIDAVGGEQALRGLRNITMESASFNRTMGQEEGPGMPPSATALFLKTYRDRAHPRVRTELEARFAGSTASTRAIQVATADGAMLVRGTTRTVGPRTFQQSSLQQLDQFMPMILLKMLDTPDSVAPAPQRRIAGQLDDGIRFTINGATTTYWFDRTTGLPALQEAVTDDAILGDATTLTTYSHWTRGAVRLPGQVHNEGGRGESTTIQRVVALNDTTLADSLFALSDSIIQAFRAQPPIPAPGGPPTVAITTVAPGILRAAGPNYNAMVVEQADRLVLVEAPLSADFTQALLDSLAARFPSKRVAWAVNTHHHWDHSGGIRTALANGIPVVTQERNVDFIRSIGTARKTVKPDALSRGRRLPQIIAMADSMTLGTGDNQVALYAFGPTAQDGGNHLVAFVPSAGVLFESDILSVPPGPRPTLPKPAAAEIIAFAQAHGLRLTQVVGGHGEVATLESIQLAAR